MANINKHAPKIEHFNIISVIIKLFIHSHRLSISNIALISFMQKIFKEEKEQRNMLGQGFKGKVSLMDYFNTNYQYTYYIYTAKHIIGELYYNKLLKHKMQKPT